jgi:hypothetical protein
MLKHLFKKITAAVNKAVELLDTSGVRYTSVPVWRPWRDY